MSQFPDFEVRGRLIVVPDNTMYPRIIAEVTDDWDQDAHVSLLAAAPKLLRALQKFLNEAKSGFALTPSGERAFEEKYSLALDAIAAALEPRP